MRYFFILCFLMDTALAQTAPIISTEARHHPEVAAKAMVVSQDEIATEIALNVLKKGGNAADAAIAAAYALAVTQPKAGNLGGGGFALYYDAKKKKTFVIDFREMAPAAAHEKMYQDKSGKVLSQKSRFTPQAVGVPGTVAGLQTLLKFGTLPHQQLIQPAIKLAEKGFPISRGLARDLRTMSKTLQKSPHTAQTFYKSGQALQTGQLLVQAQLANTLKTLSKNGPADFYTGEIAQKFCAYFEKNGGAITPEDLKNYQTKIREPVTGTYRGYTIHAMPPPSSGGVHIVQMLNILEGWKLKGVGQNSASTMHLMAETMKLAFADRSKHLGDPSYSKIPVKGLTSKKYADILRKQINLTKARPSKEILPGSPAAFESPDTTHFSIADQHGNVISFTYTINFSFGSRIVIPELGFFLNNEMDDFSAKPGVANAYGLIGGKANKVEAGKRPLSSMTPVIVFKDSKPWLITGSPGGSRIISTVLQIIVNVIDHNMNIAQATMAPRLHHQWLPDQLRVEEGFSPDTLKLLQYLGHTTVMQKNMGCAETITLENGFYYGFADPRRLDGKAKGF